MNRLFVVVAALALPVAAQQAGPPGSGSEAGPLPGRAGDPVGNAPGSGTGVPVAPAGSGGPFKGQGAPDPRDQRPPEVESEIPKGDGNPYLPQPAVQKTSPPRGRRTLPSPPEPK